MKKSLAAALLLFALALFVPAAPASAHGGHFQNDAWDANDSGSSTNHNWEWSTNGCTGIPDDWPGAYHFNHPCDHHDGCYGGHWESRLGCDNRMSTNMGSACSNDWAWWNPARISCNAWRAEFYLVARAVGWPFYSGWSIWTPL